MRPVRPGPSIVTTPTDPPCVVIDIYGWPIACDAADPCLTGHGTTLYAITACTAGNPPIAEWCVDYPGHPACTPVVEVGPPPTLPPERELPSTGSPAVALAVAALFLAVSGMWAAHRGRR